MLFSKLWKDKKAIGWIWVVAAITLIFTPFLYWALGVALDQVFAWVDSNYTFSGAMASSYLIAKTIIQFLSVFCLLSVLIWSLINSKAKRYE